jgi:hypothetical protein
LIGSQGVQPGRLCGALIYTAAFLVAFGQSALCTRNMLCCCARQPEDPLLLLFLPHFLLPLLCSRINVISTKVESAYVVFFAFAFFVPSFLTGIKYVWQGKELAGRKLRVGIALRS